jgi:cell division protease FtsH
MAKKMVREFGMSERIGPMAWGNENQVFLGEDLLHSRDYSDETARVVDEEVERILRDQEARAMRLLREHRQGLTAVAQALMQRETIDGTEVARIVDEAYGRPVHDGTAPSFAIATALGNGAGHDTEASPGEAPMAGPSFPAALQSTRLDGGTPAAGPAGAG